MRRKDSDQECEGGNSENLWSTLLSEVQTSRSAQLAATKSLLVLGMF